MTSTSKTRFVASTFPENPLPTSDFSPPASCSGIYYTNEVFAIDNDPACLPNKFNGASTAFYSPGVSCPTGYTAQPQCTNNNDVRSVTTVTCCPYRGDIALSCVADDLTLAGRWETQFCTWMAGPATVVEYTTSVSGVTHKIAATMSNRDGINAWGIRMVYQASDLAPKSTSATTTTGSGAAASVTATGTAVTATGSGASAASATAASSSTAAASASASTGLATGGIIAVAVVVPVVVIAALGGLFLWWRRRKHRYAGVQPSTPTEGSAQSPVQQGSAYAYQGGSSYTPSEMAGGGVADYYQNDKVLMTAPGQAQHTQFKGYPHPQPSPAPAELAVQNAPVELAGDYERR
ncbi:hypothetical protein CTRI78_v000347 [Colletotrichum trifolii]|uniref:Uncharacterized protein n=1 Tax=Colletotrichum trifolii TaxID=5466 RepID=A0A4R8RW68_COLTR|nr:hypothetical protein CTRI78_v000347 [Colletotrichum trifolii]